MVEGTYASRRGIEGSIINFARVVRQRARSRDFYRGSDPIHSVHRADRTA